VNNLGKSKVSGAMSTKMGLSRGFLAVAFGAALAVGCGDDDPASGAHGGSGGEAAGGEPNGGKSGSTAGKSGSGTGGSKAGSDSGGTDVGGTAGSGAAGDANPSEGGAGGTPPDAVGGAGGAGGEPTLAEVTKLHDGVFTQASDLRGLRFSSTGKIWASGHLGIIANPSLPADPDKKLIVARFMADGTPDSSFDGDGFMQLNLAVRVQAGDVITNDGNEESLGIVELANGDIVVQANIRDVNGKGMDVVLARFTSAGVPVTSFGDDGVARLVFGWAPADDLGWPTAGAAPSDSSYGLELDASGGQERLVVFGFGSAAKGQMTTGMSPVQRTDNDRYVTRVMASDGTVDPAFNGGAPFTYNTGGTFADNGRRGVVEADGSILAAGYTNFGTGFGAHVVAIRLKPDGKPDASFGFGVVDDGVIRSNPVIDDGGAAEAYAIARQHSGRIVTTGYGSATAANTKSSYDYASTIGPDLMSLGITADGKGLDESWGNLGLFVAQSEELALARAEERGRDLAVLADDRLVYVGNFATDPAIYVVMPDGSFDPANGIGQLFRYDPLTVTVNGTNTQTSHFFRVVVSADGKRVAASSSQNVDGARLALLKVGE
jgi:uncharacterized delta-60 repeat protein